MKMRMETKWNFGTSGIRIKEKLILWSLKIGNHFLRLNASWVSVQFLPIFCISKSGRTFPFSIKFRWRKMSDKFRKVSFVLLLRVFACMRRWFELNSDRVLSPEAESVSGLSLRKIISTLNRLGNTFQHFLIQRFCIMRRGLWRRRQRPADCRDEI